MFNIKYKVVAPVLFAILLNIIFLWLMGSGVLSGKWLLYASTLIITTNLTLSFLLFRNELKSVDEALKHPLLLLALTAVMVSFILIGSWISSEAISSTTGLPHDMFPVAINILGHGFGVFTGLFFLSLITPYIVNVHYTYNTHGGALSPRKTLLDHARNIIKTALVSVFLIVAALSALHAMIKNSDAIFIEASFIENNGNCPAQPDKQLLMFTHPDDRPPHMHGDAVFLATPKPNNKGYTFAWGRCGDPNF